MYGPVIAWFFGSYHWKLCYVALQCSVFKFWIKQQPPIFALIVRAVVHSLSILTEKNGLCPFTFSWAAFSTNWSPIRAIFCFEAKEACPKSLSVLEQGKKSVARSTSSPATAGYSRANVRRSGRRRDYGPTKKPSSRCDTSQVFSKSR